MTDDVHRQLTVAGQRWRADQPPPPPAGAELFASASRRPGWPILATVAAVVAVVVLAAATLWPNHTTKSKPAGRNLIAVRPGSVVSYLPRYGRQDRTSVDCGVFVANPRLPPAGSLTGPAASHLVGTLRLNGRDGLLTLRARGQVSCALPGRLPAGAIELLDAHGHVVAHALDPASRFPSGSLSYPDGAVEPHRVATVELRARSGDFCDRRVRGAAVRLGSSLLTVAVSVVPCSGRGGATDFWYGPVDYSHRHPEGLPQPNWANLTARLRLPGRIVVPHRYDRLWHVGDSRDAVVAVTVVLTNHGRSTVRLDPRPLPWLAIEPTLNRTDRLHMMDTQLSALPALTIPAGHSVRVTQRVTVHFPFANDIDGSPTGTARHDERYRMTLLLAAVRAASATLVVR